MHRFVSVAKRSAALSSIAGASLLYANHETHAEAPKTIPAHEFLYRPLSKDPTPKDSIELDTSAPMRKRMESMVMRVQDDICNGIEAIEQGAKFRTDEYERENNGGIGRTRVLQDGKVFEKAGVGVSIVHGNLPPRASEQMRNRGHDIPSDRDLPFYACGISLVMHPHNPMAPTIHLNYRIFEVETGKNEDGTPKTQLWFGGGADLTPSYLFPEDARHFHGVYKTIMDKHDETLYPQFKKNCDDYFYIPHRKEHRGIGGFFYDDLEENNEKTFAWVRECANAMLDSYVPIIEKRKDMPFTQAQKEWQQMRRGRYVEFNVMYDRGTKFGLYAPSPRVESILMSLPLTARWEYMHVPKKGSWEEETLKVLQEPVEWMQVPETDLGNMSTSELIKELARRSEQ